jgi:hypothetical protein
MQCSHPAVRNSTGQDRTEEDKEKKEEEKKIRRVVGK